MDVLSQETDVGASSFLEGPVLESHTVHVPSSEALYLDFTNENLKDSSQDAENKIMNQFLTTTDGYSMAQTHHDNYASSSQQQLSNPIHSKKRQRSGQSVTSITPREHHQLELHVVLEKYLSLRSDESDCFKCSGPHSKFFKIDDDDYESQSTASTQDYEEQEHSFPLSLSTEPEKCESLMEKGKDLESLFTNPIQEDGEEYDTSCNSFFEKLGQQIGSSFASFLHEDTGDCESCYSKFEDYEDSIQDNIAHHVSSVIYPSEEDEYYESSFSSPMKVEDQTCLSLSTSPPSVLPLTPPSTNQYSGDEKENIYTSPPNSRNQNQNQKPFSNILKSRKLYRDSSDEETTISSDATLRISIYQSISKHQANKPRVESSTKKLKTRRARNELQTKRANNTTSSLEAATDASAIKSITMCGQSVISNEVVRTNKRKLEPRDCEYSVHMF
jgi:hypothetical protein